jgi:hypothetical protein
LSRPTNDLTLDSLSPVSRTPATRKILLDAVHPLLSESLTPTPDRVSLHAQSGGDLLVRSSLGGLKNHLGALRLPHGDGAAAGPSLKRYALTGGELNLLSNPH